MIMTVLRLGRLSLLGAPLGLVVVDAVDGEVLGDIASAGADNDTGSIISKNKVMKKESKTKEEYTFKGTVIYVM